MDLKLWDNGNDIVIAESAEEAHRLVKEASGCTDEEAAGDGWEIYGYDVIRLDPDEIGVDPTTYTPDQIIAYRGKGYLCSRDY